MKECSRCKSEKPLGYFPKNRSKPDGVNGWCKQCSAEYLKEWRIANQDSIKLRQAEWYGANREKIIARSAAWYAANPERAAEARAAWSVANREKTREYGAKWRSANPEKARAVARAWREQNPGPGKIHVQRRRQRKASAPGDGVTSRQWASQIAPYGGRCAYCDAVTSVSVMEHMVPLSRGGAHDVTNVVPACRRCNSKKGTMTALEFFVGRRLDRKVG